MPLNVVYETRWYVYAYVYADPNGSGRFLYWHSSMFSRPRLIEDLHYDDVAFMCGLRDVFSSMCVEVL